jgi:glycerophosphoryl diester phosphodiesterase
MGLPQHVELSGRRVWLKYHRLLSGSGRFPPNSLSALQEVVEGGAFALEFDVRLLGDGTWVLHHDPTLDRETTGLGPLRAVDLSAYKALRLRGSGEPPATLAEAVAYLAASPRALKVQVDLKEEVLALEEALAFLRALEPLRANPNLRVVVSSLADWNLRLLKRLDPALAIGLDPAYYLDAPVGTWSRLPVRVNAYGYLDDHPLGFHRFMPVRAYLEDRLERSCARCLRLRSFTCGRSSCSRPLGTASILWLSPGACGTASWWTSGPLTPRRGAWRSTSRPWPRWGWTRSPAIVPSDWRL